jgi:prophage regulatory protein
MSDRLVRLKDIIGSTESSIPPIISCSRTTWFDGVKSGRFPKPIKIGRMTFWKYSDIQRIINGGD